MTTAELDTLTGAMNFEQVRSVLAHRFPFLMIDRVTSFERGNRLVATRHVSGNDICFLGHFPDEAIMPGVLQVEAMAQAVSLLDALSGPEAKAAARFLGHVNAQFFRPVVPGDSMEIEVLMLKQVRGGVVAKSVVRVDGEAAARAEITLGVGRGGAS